MSRWFRHYAGMMRDEKLVAVAVRAKQPVERVLWVWGAILESAAEINDGGRYALDNAEAAYFLRVELDDINSITAGLEAAGRVASGVVVSWCDRQFQSDASASRQAAYRERRRKASMDIRDAVAQEDVTKQDGDVTPPSRDGEVTPQETETETETEKREREVARVVPLPKILDEVTVVEEIHRQQAADLLETANLTDWERQFIGSIKACRRLSSFQREKFQSIIEAHANAPPAAKGKYTAADLRKMGLNV